MRIKEAERQTGLTAKAIRLYESKGLLTVERHAGNDYRDYSEEDVKRLKTIAVLRKLEIPISDIKRWTDGKVALTELLHGVARQSDAELERLEARKNLAEHVAIILEEYPEKTVEGALEDAEFLDLLVQDLQEIVTHDQSGGCQPILMTIGLGAGIFMTILHILGGDPKDAILSFLGTMAALLVCVWFWQKHFRVERSKRHWKDLPIGLVTVLAIPVVVAIYLLLHIGVSKWVFPQAMWLWIPPVWAILVSVYGGLFLLLWMEKERRTWRNLLIYLGIYGLLLYGCITSSNLYADGGFVRYHPWAPGGQVYSVKEIARVETGFDKSGAFYYHVSFADGWTPKLEEASVYGDDHPQELLELDRELMERGICKQVNGENSGRVNYDPETKTIYDEILANTG